MVFPPIFLCIPIAVSSPTALTCLSGEKVILADLRAAASEEGERQRQKQSLAQIVLGKPLQCKARETRGEAIVGQCSFAGRDIAIQQVLAGGAQLRPRAVITPPPPPPRALAGLTVPATMLP
jgi:hypothetical protein